MNFLPENFPNFNHADQKKWHEMASWFVELSTQAGISEAKAPKLGGFDLFEMRYNFLIHNSFAISNTLGSYNLLTVQYALINEPYYANRQEALKEWEITHFWGYLKLKSNYGRAFIRPETWQDKFKEFFFKDELEFNENEQFNDMFYVLTNDKKDFASKVNRGFLDLMCNFPEFIIEFNGDACLITTLKTVTKDELFELTKLGIGLDNVLNHG